MCEMPEGQSVWCDAGREGEAVKVATGVFDGGSVRCVWCGLPSKSVNSTGLCFHKFAPYCCLMNRPAPPNPPPPSPSLLIPLSLPSWVPVSVCGLMLRQQDDAGLGAVPAARSLPEQGRRYPAAKSALDGMTNHKRRILLYRHESFPFIFFLFRKHHILFVSKQPQTSSPTIRDP